MHRIHTTRKVTKETVTEGASQFGVDLETRRHHMPSEIIIRYWNKTRNSKENWTFRILCNMISKSHRAKILSWPEEMGIFLNPIQV